jgi:hypothetical protein
MKASISSGCRNDIAFQGDGILSSLSSFLFYFVNGSSNWNKVTSHCGLIFISLMTSDAECFFKYFLAIHVFL